jgi:peptide/nickel transport system substrate-binding protein
MRNAALRLGAGGMRRILATLALVLGFAAPALARDMLTIGLSSYPTQFHPYADPEAVKSYIEAFALRPVTAFDADWHNTCLLCAELPSVDSGTVKIEERPPALPGMAVTIKLRPGLKWGDGTPVTSRDIAFTVRVGRDPQSGFANTRTWGKVERVEVIDDLTVVLHLDEVSTEFDRISELLPAHLEEPIYDRFGPTEYLHNSLYNTAPTTPGLWNGPYLVSEVSGGNTVALAPNPYWSGAPPKIKKIVLRSVENTSSLLASLLAGDFDMTPGEGVGLSVDQTIVLARTQPQRFDYIFRPSLDFDHIDLQLDNPILADVRVRRALLAAIDRPTLSEKLFDSKFSVADSFVSPLEADFDKDIPPVPYDPAAARKLLAEAGWQPGADGVCVNAAGQRLNIEFRVAAGAKLRELIEQVIQSEWKKVCVDTTIHNELPRALFGETLKKRSFQGAVLYAWAFPVQASPRQILGSDQIPTAENNWSGTNYPGWRNEVADQAIKEIETELDPEKRQEAWIAIQRAYAEELPSLPLFHRVEGYAIPKYLHGLTPTGHTDSSALWSENWTLDP